MQRRIPDRGSTVWIRDRKWWVERARIDRGVMRLDVRDRRATMTFLAPFDRTAIAERSRRLTRARPRAAAARLARLSAATIGYTGVWAARDARVDLLAYQLEPALAVLGGARRLLIADEVGLGKTIQAGLVAAELQRRRGTIHALVICPAALAAQWQEELAGRFGLDARIAGADTFVLAGECAPPGATPWRRAGVWIGSYDYLKQAHVLEGIPLAPWDLVIVDEAHEAAGDTIRHQACDELARRARHVLLLTATPHSGEAGRFDRMLAIGAHGPAGATPPLTFQRTRADAGVQTARHVRWHVVRPSAEESQLLDALVAYERALLQQAGKTHRDAALLLLSIFRKRALSSATALGRSLERRLDWLMAPDRVWALDWLQPSLNLEGDDDVGADERQALTIDVGWAGANERVWIRRLETLAEAASGRETKIRRLAGLVGRTREPLVVFTEFRDSLDALRGRLAPLRPLAVLHGGLSPVERARELGRFLDGPATVLLATDVAGQGLNLQARARWVVSLELPWNPTRLEQRIGRVDRIGQRAPVHATLLLTRHPHEHALLRSMARRALTARRALGARMLASLLPPTELMVAHSLLAGGSPPEGLDALEGTAGPAAVPLETGWQRRARALARLLQQKRALAARWRGSDPGGRPRRCAWRTATRAAVTRGAVAVLSVPILDGAGTELERHLLVLGGWTAGLGGADAGRGPASAVWLPAVMTYARRIARERLDARRRRLTRLLSRAADLAAVGEAGIGAHLHARRYPERSQPGLFTAGPQRAFESARDEARLLLVATAERVAEQQQAVSVTIGEPVLELLFTPR